MIVFPESRDCNRLEVIFEEHEDDFCAMEEEEEDDFCTMKEEEKEEDVCTLEEGVWEETICALNRDPEEMSMETDGTSLTGSSVDTKINSCSKAIIVEQTTNNEEHADMPLGAKLPILDQNECEKPPNYSNHGKRRKVQFKITMESREDELSLSSGSLESLDRKRNCSDLENPDPVGETEPEAESLGLLQSWQDAFTWDEFFYSVTLGFLPTAWDVFSDLTIASKLKIEVGIETAGLSYLFVCLPGITLLLDLFSIRLTKSCSSAVVLVVYSTLFTGTAAALIFCFLWDPLLLEYPSIVLGIFVVGVKGLCIFVHTEAMKEFSTKVSVQEYTWESSLQLLLLLHIWINGGPLFLSPILSSVLLIGKVSTEFYLISEPENLLKEKSFLEKLKLIAKHLPVFTLTAFFRLGSSITKHSAPIVNITNPLPTVFFFLAVFSMCFVYFVLYSLLFVGLKLCFPILKDLPLSEVGQFIISEFTTITPWGRLTGSTTNNKKTKTAFLAGWDVEPAGGCRWGWPPSPCSSTLASPPWSHCR